MLLNLFIFNPFLKRISLNSFWISFESMCDWRRISSESVIRFASVSFCRQSEYSKAQLSHNPWCSLCALNSFWWTSPVTFTHHMYIFACTNKFHHGTFSINCVIKDLVWCQSRELYFVKDIYAAKLTLLSKTVHYYFEPKMIKAKHDHPLSPPPLQPTG